MAIEVIQVRPGDGLERARAIRSEVFIDEFDVTAEEEYDDLDDAPGTVHVVAVSAGHDMGTARLVSDAARPGVAHITRVAVRSDARGTGVGRAMMVALEEIARRAVATGDPPAVRLELSIMEDAVGFYESLGYEVGAERHVEVRIPHRYAWKDLVGRT